MHWARASVTPMLALRNAVCNDRWDEAWQQSAAHIQQFGLVRRAVQAKRVAAPEGAPPAVVQVVPAATESAAEPLLIATIIVGIAMTMILVVTLVQLRPR